MYFQITSRCNMSCKHCGFACTKNGEDMTIETFRNALKQEDECITLGGGESTLHPFFWQILMESVAVAESVWLATNGSQTEIALALSKLAKKGVVAVDLSLDKFHDPIDKRVVEAFKKKPTYNQYAERDNDLRGVRNTSSRLIKSGRCKVGRRGCICEDLFVKPNGDVMGCGCKKAEKFGNINTSFDVPDWYNSGECSVRK